MDSPLSFSSSEIFRKKLIVRNLPPYKVENSFSTGDIPASGEIQLIDYAIKDSPKIESIGGQQEKKLFIKNQYTPEGKNNYGDAVVINLDLGYKTNEGEYNYSDTVGSNLEIIGNDQEKILYVKNLYAPSSSPNDYGSTVNINNTLLNDSNLGSYGYPLTIGSDLEKIGDNQEVFHIVKNVYKPIGLGQFGDTVWYINDDQTILTMGEGEYTIDDTLDSYLYQIGNKQEIFHKLKNLYKPENPEDYGQTVWSINNDETIQSMGGGIYNIKDTLKSYLFQIGNKREIFHKTKNVYKPPNPADYGNTVWYINNDQTILTTGSGVYNRDDADDSYLSRYGNAQEIFHKVKNIYRPNLSKDFGEPAYWINNDEYIDTAGSGEYNIADTLNNYLEQQGNKQENLLIAINKYTPENSTQYGTTRWDINDISTLGSNEGEYGYPDTLNNTLFNDGIVLRPQMSVLNQYNPNKPNPSDVYYNKNVQKNANEGEYGFPDTINSPLEVIAEKEEKDAYVINKFVSGTGNYGNPELVTIDDLQIPTYGLPYSDMEGFPVIFLPSTYTPFSILLSNNPSGSAGSLSQDSALAQVGAKQLNKEFKFRVALELFQQTLGRVNVLDSSIDTDTGEISTKPNTDPFDAIGLLSGNIPLYSKDYTITNPDLFLGQAINFAARLAGTYSPYSFIPGEYFDYPDKKGSAIFNNPLSAIGGAIGGVFRLLNSNTQNGSELFVEYTSIATRSLLYDQLRYNVFRPDYKFGNNLLAPQGNFYIGKRKSQLTDIVSPDGELPESKIKGVAARGPVFSYGKIGQEYEGTQMDKPYSGLNSRSFIDGLSGVQGGFTWLSKAGRGNKNWMLPGDFAGPGGEAFQDESEFNFSLISSVYEPTQSTNIEFTNGSLLDVTQKLVDAGNRSDNKLQHVGNAINQVSKVFNDGYIELTKGSRVVRYTTPNSVPDSSNSIKGYEYCRVFTKDRPYYSFDELQKTDGNIRKQTWSVLDNTFNLNIAPWQNPGSTNIQNGKVKKYMFSLENLAWRTSNKPGFTYEDLPECERGPNGGRIMWFPPYDLKFGEEVSTGWQDNSFLGRPEPIYTYTNTKRSGSFSFKIIVDHPSIMNVILEEELNKAKASETEITKVLASFFAGCTKYDLYDLVRKFPMFTPNDVFQVIEQRIQPDDLVEIINQEPVEVISWRVEESYTTTDTPDKPTATPPPSASSTPTPTPTPTPTATEPIRLVEGFTEVVFFYHHDHPKFVVNPSIDKLKAQQPYPFWYDFYQDLKTLYKDGGNDTIHNITGSYNRILKYDDIEKKSYNNYVLNTLSDEAQKKYLDSFVETRDSQINEFFEYVTESYNKSKEYLVKISDLLDKGYKIRFTLQGSASAVQVDDINYSLSVRRIDAVKQYLFSYVTPAGKTIKDYFDSGALIINPDPQGKQIKDLEDEKYKFVKCNKKFVTALAEGVVSVNAMACRRSRILNTEIIYEPPQPVQVGSQATQDQTNTQNESELPPIIESIPEGTTTPTEEFGVPTTVVTSSSTTTYPPPIVRRTKQDPIIKRSVEPRSDLTKRLARKLLTECNYFELVKQKDPMIYDGLKSKLKYFHPVFHSITPEGLNARLTFLQQCMRPGDTIPTVSKDGDGTQLLYNDVTNSVFGAPPICVLRIGDFFHTKIAIESMSFNYDERAFDLNPEGIGVQPMIADVQVRFNFIGAHGLKNPVAKLQNALSFNFYANTEVYDERAEVTEDVTTQYDAALLNDIKDQLGIYDNGNKERTNTQVDTIGIVKSSDYDLLNQVPYGTIGYQEIMATLIDLTKTYVDTTFNGLDTINNQFLIGGLIMSTADRKYTEGYFDNLTGNTSYNAFIYGKSDTIQDKVQKLVKDAKNDVDNDLCPLLPGIASQNFNNSQTRKIKRYISDLINQRGDELFGVLEASNTSIADNELKLINVVDKLNFVATSYDGYENKRKDYIIYSLSGSAAVDASSQANNTFDELKQDFLKIRSDLNEFYNNLYFYQVIPSGQTYTYNDDFVFDTFIEPQNAIDSSENRFFILFAKKIIDDSVKFIDDIIENTIKNEPEADKTAWKTYFTSTIDDPNGLKVNYLNSKKISDERLNKLRNYYTTKYNTYNPFNKDKKRVMFYQGQVPPSATNIQNLKDVWSDQSSSGDKFNLKKEFK